MGATAEWSQILTLWGLVDADLHAVYGIDSSSGILAHRTASWLTSRIAGLLCQQDTMLARALRNQPEG